MKPKTHLTTTHHRSGSGLLQCLPPALLEWRFRRHPGVWIVAIAASLTITTISLLAADRDVVPRAAAAGVTEDWLQGTEEERTRLTSKHLRGLDVTMVETGYRYTELYWAGQDRNWEFAKYQLDKIRHVIELGIERRPKRGASAQNFLTNAIPLIKQTLERQDAAAFDTQFKQLTAACNVCHAMEKMPFVQIHPPEHRHSPVKYLVP